MADILDLSDPDFTAQMQGLIQQAQEALDGRAAAARREGQGRAAEKQALERPVINEAQERALQSYQSLPQMLRPFVQGLEAISRATGENTQILSKLDKTSADSLEPLRQLPAVVSELQGLLEKKDALSKQMFDALHEELRTYKDGFLLDSVHRPMIRDLITLYDDLSEIFNQMREFILAQQQSGATEGLDRFKTIEVNLEHNLEFILEVLARLEVTQLPVGKGKLDKKSQRAMSVEGTEDPDEDMNVVRTLKRGFLWKDRVVRPEEVIIKKWQEGFLVALHSPAKSPSSA